MLADSSYGTLTVKRIGGMLMENSNIEIIGGGLFFTEIEVKNDNEIVPSESDKEAIRKNIEEIEYLKRKKKRSKNETV